MERGAGVEPALSFTSLVWKTSALPFGQPRIVVFDEGIEPSYQSYQDCALAVELIERTGAP